MTPYLSSIIERRMKVAVIVRLNCDVLQGLPLQLRPEDLLVQVIDVRSVVLSPVIRQGVGAHVWFQRILQRNDRQDESNKKS